MNRHELRWIAIIYWVTAVLTGWIGFGPTAEYFAFLGMSILFGTLLLAAVKSHLLRQESRQRYHREQASKRSRRLRRNEPTRYGDRLERFSQQLSPGARREMGPVTSQMQRFVATLICAACPRPNQNPQR